MTRKLAALAVSAAALAAPSAAAAAAPCNGFIHTDPKNDQQFAPVLGAFPLAAETGPANLDLTGVYAETKPDASGKLVSTLNLRVQDLTLDAPPAGARAGDRIVYTINFGVLEDGTYGAQAIIDGGEMTFALARYAVEAPTPLGSIWTGGGITNPEAEGSYTLGKDGVISIELPEALGKPGTTLEGVYADVAIENGEPVWYLSDQAPDDGDAAAKDVTLKECPAPASAPEPAAPAPVAAAEGGTGQTVTESGPAPQPQGQPSPAPASQPAAPRKTSKRAACLKKARKLKGAKRKKALRRCKKLKK